MEMTANYSSITSQPEYDIDFWNLMRNKAVKSNTLSKGMETNTGTYKLPSSSLKQVSKIIDKESVFRKMATNIGAYKTGYRIYAKDCKDKAQFVAEGEAIPIYEGIEDFTKYCVESHKLTAIVKLDEDFVNDAAFDIEKYLSEKFGKSFARAEDNAFVCGTGNGEPTGILHDTAGADVGVEASKLTYDDVISLYFSVASEYRRNGVWIMNDKTALTLRKLKDADGNYLWNSNNDTILGKPVVISEYMPDIENGLKPIAFGDFSYYWIIDRKPVSVRTLTEKFAFYDQIGYLAMEFLDAKLVRSEAIKVIKMSNSNENV